MILARRVCAQLRTYIAVYRHPSWTPVVIRIGGQLDGQAWSWTSLRRLLSPYADDYARPPCDDKARKTALLVLISGASGEVNRPRIRGDLPIRHFSVRFRLGVLTWTSWAAPESVGRAGKVVLPSQPVTWRPSAAVQARALRSSAERGVRGHELVLEHAERLE